MALLAWLVYDCQRKDPETFSRLWTQPKAWGPLLAALAAMLVATALSFLRWFLLVRALEIPFRLADAFRLGSLGFLFNFVGPGQVGGDLVKALMLVRQHKERRVEAIGTIFLDRAVGLYAVMVVASVAVAWGDLSHLGELASMMHLVQLLTLLGAVVIGLLLLPARFSQPWLAPLERIPKLGGFLLRAQRALDMYRRRLDWLAAVAVLSLSVHILIGVSIHLADKGLFRVTPTFVEHMIISPLSSVAGGLPIAPGGLGTYEFAMRYLFNHVPRMSGLQPGQGLVVALCYRLITLIVALAGVVYYWAHRQEVRDVIEEAREEEVRETHVTGFQAAAGGRAELRNAAGGADEAGDVRGQRDGRARQAPGHEARQREGEAPAEP
jgi:uncharacterized protein (TIRG00374 family)